MIVLLQPGSGAEGRRGRLLDGEAHHLRVRRAREGEMVELRDGAGLVGRGRLVAVSGEWEVEIDQVETRPAAPGLVLAVGAGDRERFATVVEKAVELGVTRVVPLLTERSAGVATRLRSGQLERLRRQALEGVKQSGNPWACGVEEPVAMPEFLSRPAEGRRWLADVGGTPIPATLGPEPVTVVVGPEGGLSEPERAAAAAAGYQPVRLGPHTLRFETAAIAAAAAVQAARLRGSNG
ncbi:MAG TPA: RsmE family RNA methyltransferase [Gemmatimonadales bacterium]|nr:RsmE family RNA methyltransferase [Gemmatimonadales bacterium]